MATKAETRYGEKVLDSGLIKTLSYAILRDGDYLYIPRYEKMHYVPREARLYTVALCHSLTSNLAPFRPTDAG